MTATPAWLVDVLADHEREGLIQYDCRCGDICRGRVEVGSPTRERKAHASHVADLVWAELEARGEADDNRTLRRQLEKTAGRLANAEARLAQAEAENCTPLRSDHPAIVNAEKAGYERGWDDSRTEATLSYQRLENEVKQLRDDLVKSYEAKNRWQEKAEDFEGRYEVCHSSRMHAEECWRSERSRADEAESDLSEMRAGLRKIADQWERYGRRPPEYLWATLRALLGGDA